MADAGRLRSAEGVVVVVEPLDGTTFFGGSGSCWCGGDGEEVGEEPALPKPDGGDVVPGLRSLIMFCM